MEFNWNSALEVAASAGPAPDGEYRVLVEEASAVRAASSGNPMIKAKLRIIQPGPHMDKTVYNNFVIKMDSAWTMHFFFDRMSAFGLDSAFFAANPSVEAVADTLVGREAIAVLKTGEWNGRKRNEADSFRPAVGGSTASLPALGLPPVPVAPPFAPATPSTPAVNTSPIAAPSAPPGLPI